VNYHGNSGSLALRRRSGPCGKGFPAHVIVLILHTSRLLEHSKHFSNDSKSRKMSFCSRIDRGMDNETGSRTDGRAGTTRAFVLLSMACSSPAKDPTNEGRYNASRTQRRGWSNLANVVPRFQMCGTSSTLHDALILFLRTALLAEKRGDETEETVRRNKAEN
jgi:hypothetical protein